MTLAKNSKSANITTPLIATLLYNICGTQCKIIDSWATDLKKLADEDINSVGSICLIFGLVGSLVDEVCHKMK